MMKVITREAAMAAGLKRFFTGEPCKHGHVDERYVNYSGCVACHVVRARASRRQSKPRAETARGVARAVSDGFIKAPTRARLMAGR